MTKIAPEMRRSLLNKMKHTDRVELPSDAEMQKIIQWSNDYWDNTSYTPDKSLTENLPFDALVFDILKSNKDYHTQLYVEFSEKETGFAIFLRDGLSDFFVYRDGGIYTPPEMEPSESKIDVFKRFLVLVASAITYMKEYQEEPSYVSRREVRAVETKKPKKGKKQPRKTPIRRTVYKIIVPLGDIPKLKKPRQWKTDSWTVRGHWRQYKSGKRVWITPYQKGDRDKKPEPKIYTL
ncbi:hypothetical protein D1872_81870 [compost metagenome]